MVTSSANIWATQQGVSQSISPKLVAQQPPHYCTGSDRLHCFANPTPRVPAPRQLAPPETPSHLLRSLHADPRGNQLPLEWNPVRPLATVRLLSSLPPASPPPQRRHFSSPRAGLAHRARRLPTPVGLHSLPLQPRQLAQLFRNFRLAFTPTRLRTSSATPRRCLDSRPQAKAEGRRQKAE